MKGWGYIADPLGSEKNQYANETIKKGKEQARTGMGDCDDFAILMAALVESIGATPRIVLAYDSSTGHAYTEVYLGDLGSEDNQVEEVIQWLREKYLLDNVYVHINPETKDVWLNLDWGQDSRGNSHPCGPFFKAKDHRVVAMRDAMTPLRVIKIHRMQSTRAILPQNSGEIIQLAQLNLVSPKQVAWSPVGNLLAVSDYNIYLYDTRTWEQVRIIDTRGWINSVAFSPDGKILASAGMGSNGVKLWDVANGGEKLSFDDISSANGVDFSPDGKILAVAVDMTVKLLDVENGHGSSLISMGSQVSLYTNSY